jgi:hypothetical protein
MPHVMLHCVITLDKLHKKFGHKKITWYLIEMAIASKYNYQLLIQLTFCLNGMVICNWFYDLKM